MTAAPIELPSPQLPLRGVGDVDKAYRDWGATCGPAALAASLELLVDDVRKAVSPTGRFPGFMGVFAFKSAIPRAGGRIVRQWSKPDQGELAETDGSPILVLMRWLGPWDGIPNERARAKVQATKRHAFCYRHGYFGPLTHFRQGEHGPGWVMDANNAGPGGQAGWMPAWWWRENVLPGLVPTRGSGEWAIDWMAQIERERN